MRNMLIKATLAAALVVPMMSPANAYEYRDSHGHTHYSRDRYYRHHCGGGNGAVGTVAGGVGGAVIGNAIGGGALGTVAGGVGGALLGRHLDKQNTRHRRGC